MGSLALLSCNLSFFPWRNGAFFPGLEAVRAVDGTEEATRGSSPRLTSRKVDQPSPGTGLRIRLDVAVDSSPPLVERSRWQPGGCRRGESDTTYLSSCASPTRILSSTSPLLSRFWSASSWGCCCGSLARWCGACSLARVAHSPGREPRQSSRCRGSAGAVPGWLVGYAARPPALGSSNLGSFLRA